MCDFQRGGVRARAWLVTAVLCLPAWVEASELSVPAARHVQQLSVPVPRGDWAPGIAGKLVEIGHDGATVTAHLSAFPTADGTLDEQHLALQASLPPTPGQATTRQFAFTPTSPTEHKGFAWEDLNEKSVHLTEGDDKVLTYNHGTIIGESVPASDLRRQRGCYLHPVWGMNGEVLTDDFPKDHYHHHGIFWAWPYVRVNDESHDLWMYTNIRQQFVRWICRDASPAGALLAMENGWFVGEEQVMTERVWLRAHPATDEGRALDVSLFLIPGDKPVELRGMENKSYGGLTMRFRVFPERIGAEVTVPSGVRRHVGKGMESAEDLSNVPLPWADLSAEFSGSGSRSGAAIFVSPNHPDYPPAWLTRCYGALCVGWPGVEPITLVPGQPVRLDYRLWVHKTAATGDHLADVYDAYVTASRAKWIE